MEKIVKRVMLGILSFGIISCSTTDTSDKDNGGGTEDLAPLTDLHGTWELSEKEMLALDGTKIGTTLKSFFTFKADHTIKIESNTGTDIATAKIAKDTPQENLTVTFVDEDTPSKEVTVAWYQFDTTADENYADKWIAFIADENMLFMSRIGDTRKGVKENLLLSEEGGASTVFSHNKVTAEPVFQTDSDFLVDQVEGHWGLSRTAILNADDSVFVKKNSFYSITDKAIEIKHNIKGESLGSATFEDTVSKVRTHVVGKENNTFVTDIVYVTMSDKTFAIFLKNNSIYVSKADTTSTEVDQLLNDEGGAELFTPSDTLESLPIFKDFDTVYALFQGDPWKGTANFETTEGTTPNPSIPTLTFEADTVLLGDNTLGTTTIEDSLSPEKVKVSLTEESPIWVDLIWTKFGTGLFAAQYVGYFIVDDKDTDTLYATRTGTQEEVQEDLAKGTLVVSMATERITGNPLEEIKADLEGVWADSVVAVADWGGNTEVIPTGATYTFVDGALTITGSDGAELMTGASADVTNPATPSGDATSHDVINLSPPAEDDITGSIPLQTKGALLLELSNNKFIGAVVVEGKLYITPVANSSGQFTSGWGAMGSPGNKVYQVAKTRTTP